MKAMPKIGVALYADSTPYSREGNVACEYRKQPFEFSSVSDLPGQTLWVTNCNLRDLVSAGLHRNPKIAHEGYFRSRLAQMIQELGLTKMPLVKQAAILSEVLGNAAEMARLQLGLTQYPSYGIANAVGQLHGAAEAPEGSAVLRVAEQACQRYTACERDRRYENAEVFSFWMPRFLWANDLLSQPLPINGNLRSIQPHMLPAMGKDPGLLVEWATENNIPLFARIKIQGLEETVGKLMNYGSGAQDVTRSTNSGSYEARNFREWCALPELDTLSQVGEVDILQVAVAEDWTRSGLLLHKSKASAVSYAYGLVAENLWVGLTRKPTNGQVSRSLSTAWIQSIDRMRCLRVAERLHNMGMEIVNYGNGRITVVCPPSVRALIPQAALEENMLFPACLEDLSPYQPQPNNPTHVSQHLLNKRDHSRMIQVDQAALKSMQDALIAK